MIDENQLRDWRLFSCGFYCSWGLNSVYQWKQVLFLNSLLLFNIRYPFYRHGYIKANLYSVLSPLILCHHLALQHTKITSSSPVIETYLVLQPIAIGLDEYLDDCLYTECTSLYCPVYISLNSQHQIVTLPNTKGRVCIEYFTF